MIHRRMRVLLMAFAIFLTTINCENMLKFEEKNNELDNSASLHRIMKRMTRNNDKDSENKDGSGDDDEDSNHISGSGEEESSGGSPYEGSGEGDAVDLNTTHKPDGTTDNVEDIFDGKVTTTTTKKPKTTQKMEKKTTERPTTTMDNSVEVSENTNKPAVAKKRQDPNDESDDDDDEGGISFTLGIVIGVVVGSILAILIIVLLVYRLRKKDEGSYSLDDQSSTQFIRDPDSPQKGGKEYLA